MNMTSFKRTVLQWLQMLGFSLQIVIGSLKIFCCFLLYPVRTNSTPLPQMMDSLVVGGAVCSISLSKSKL